MACALPSISTDCIGSKEVIRDGIDGIIVENHNADKLAQAIHRLISNKDERNRLSEKAVEVVERFSYDKVMAKWHELLYSLK